MKRVEWSNEASAEFLAILQRIAEDNPIAAGRVARRIKAAISKLRSTNSGRIGRVEGTFEKVVSKTSYIVAYTFRENAERRPELYIVHIIHGARDWPEGSWPE